MLSANLSSVATPTVDAAVRIYVDRTYTATMSTGTVAFPQSTSKVEYLRRLFRLKEIVAADGTWDNREIFMCESNMCSNKLTNRYEQNILSFAEDFNGNFDVTHFLS